MSGRKNEPALTVYPDLLQGSEEWKAARCGLLTASVIGKLIVARRLTPIDYACPDCGSNANQPCASKVRKAGEFGAPIKTMHPGRVAVVKEDNADPVLEVANNDTAGSVTLSLAAERITGHVDEMPVSASMWRGKIEEPLARDKYAEVHAPVVEVGLMVRTFGGTRIGFSPDGLVGDDGAIEIKSRSQTVQVKHVIDGDIPAENMAQLQTGLLVSGRKWIDYVSYSGGMALWCKRVTPDPKWFEVIVAAAQQFETEAADIVARYQAATDGLPMTERTLDYDLEPVI